MSYIPQPRTSYEAILRQSSTYGEVPSNAKTAVVRWPVQPNGYQRIQVIPLGSNRAREATIKRVSAYRSQGAQVRFGSSNEQPKDELIPSQLDFGDGRYQRQPLYQRYERTMPAILPVSQRTIRRKASNGLIKKSSYFPRRVVAGYGFLEPFTPSQASRFKNVWWDEASKKISVGTKPNGAYWRAL